MDRPECHEEKGLDWRGSAPECRFNFAFLPSAWIKANIRLAEQTANISSQRRWKGSGKFYRAWRRTANAASGLWRALPFSLSPYTPFLSFSRPLAHRSFFTMLFIGFEKMIRSRCAFGKREMPLSSCRKNLRNFIPDYEAASRFAGVNCLDFKGSPREHNKVVTCVYVYSTTLLLG